MNQTIGEKLKVKRLELGLSVEKVSTELKIRPEFIIAIEKNDYSTFASDVYAKGFIKNYSKFLNLNSENFVATYRRDIEKINLKPKDKTSSDNSTSRNLFLSGNKLKITGFSFILLILFLFISNLLNTAFQIPLLEIYNPVNLVGPTKQELEVDAKTLKLIGKTNSGSTIKINGIILPVGVDNKFESDLIPITQEVNNILIEAISNVGVVNRIELSVRRKNLTIQNATEIIGAIQVIKQSANIKVIADGNEFINNQFYENDSVPVIAKQTVEIYSENADNLKIFFNSQEFKVINGELKLKFENNQLIEY